MDSFYSDSAVIERIVNTMRDRTEFAFSERKYELVLSIGVRQVGREISHTLATQLPFSHTNPMCETFQYRIFSSWIKMSVVLVRREQSIKSK